MLVGIAYWSINGVNLLLVQVFSLNLLHIIGTQKTRNISHHVATISTASDASASTSTFEVKSALPMVVVPISMLNDRIKGTLNGVVFHQIFKQENTGLQSYAGVSVVQFEHPGESIFGDFADGNIVRPLHKRHLDPAQLELLKLILRTDQRGRQEFQLGLLLDHKLVSFLVEFLFFLVYVLELVAVVVQVLHVF